MKNRYFQYCPEKSHIDCEGFKLWESTGTKRKEKNQSKRGRSGDGLPSVAKYFSKVKEQSKTVMDDDIDMTNTQIDVTLSAVMDTALNETGRRTVRSFSFYSGHCQSFCGHPSVLLRTPVLLWTSEKSL